MKRIKRFFKYMSGEIQTVDTPVIKLLKAMDTFIKLEGLKDVQVIEHTNSREIVLIYNDSTTKTIII